MNPEHQNRLALLRQRFVPIAFIREYCGFDLAEASDLMQDFQTFQGKRSRLSSPPAGRVSRYDLERFFMDRHMWPLHWAALELGMADASLEEILGALPAGAFPRKYLHYDVLVDEALERDLAEQLADLRFRTFTDHSGFCAALHQAIRDDLSVIVTPAYCATSRERREVPELYAQHFDSITLEPLSVAHEMWLDLGKPIVLPPDRCSKRFYAQHEDTLKGLTAGSGELVDIDRYRPQSREAS